MTLTRNLSLTLKPASGCRVKRKTGRNRVSVRWDKQVNCAAAVEDHLAFQLKYVLIDAAQLRHRPCQCHIEVLLLVRCGIHTVDEHHALSDLEFGLITQKKVVSLTMVILAVFCSRNSF